MSYGTVFNIVHDDLGLMKKSAHWVPHLLLAKQKEHSTVLSASFTNSVEMKGKAWLQSIVTMDELAMSLHTPERKNQPKQWLKKGSPGLIKARVNASHKNVKVLAFFDCEVMIYS